MLLTIKEYNLKKLRKTKVKKTKKRWNAHNSDKDVQRMEK